MLGSTGSVARGSDSVAGCRCGAVDDVVSHPVTPFFYAIRVTLVAEFDTWRMAKLRSLLSGEHATRCCCDRMADHCRH